MHLILVTLQKGWLSQLEGIISFSIKSSKFILWYFCLSKEMIKYIAFKEVIQKCGNLNILMKIYHFVIILV